MRYSVTLGELLLALYDSLQGAKQHARNLAVPGVRATAPDTERALRILESVGAESILATTAFDITELTLRFECELYRRDKQLGLQISRPHFWRRPPRLPLEIRLYGSLPLLTEVRLGGQLLRSLAGRPPSRPGRSEGD